MEDKKIIAIVGLSKNAGKTSFLNWYLKNLEGQTIGVSTTGRDGEEIDLLTHGKKPKVFVPENVIFTSFDYVYTKHSSMIKGLQKLHFRVIDKNLWLYESMGLIETEIVGPSTLREQEDLISLFEEKGCEVILIDGSLDRKSICLSEKITDVILVIGASTGNIEEIKHQAQKMKYLCKFKQFSIDNYNNITYKLNEQIIETNIKSIYGNESKLIDILSQNVEWIYLPGALTDNSWQKLKNIFLDYKGKIIFNHSLNLNINLVDLKRMLDTDNVYMRLYFPISAVAVNSYSPRNEHIDVELLRNELISIFSDLPVLDITEII